jgi:hypothetical protein
VNSKVYTFSRLLEWATADTVYAASAVWENGGSTTSDGKEYIIDAELAVIKNYWTATVPGVSWDSVVNTAFETAPGKIINNGAMLNATISSILSKGLGNNEGGNPTYRLKETRDFSYFKYVELMQWATNEKNFGKEALPSGSPIGSAPNLGVLMTEFGNDYNYNYT